MADKNGFITRPALWGATAFAAFLTVNGWMATQIMEMNAALERLDVTRFTAIDGELIRSEITDVATDIDKRLAIMENDVDWIRSMALTGVSSNDQFDNVGNTLPPVPVPHQSYNNSYTPWRPEPSGPAPAPPTADPDAPDTAPTPPAPSPVQQQPEPIRKYDLRSKK